MAKGGRQAVPKVNPLAKKTPEPVEVPRNAKVAILGFVVAVLALLWCATTESNFERTARQLAERFSIKMPNAEVTYNAEGRPTLIAKRNLPAGQAVISVPVDSILEYRGVAQSDVGEFLRYDNATVMQQIAEENKLQSGAYNVLSNSLYLARERRLGSGSKFAKFFELAAKPLNSGLYWNDDVLACADAAVMAEINALRAAINATVAYTAFACGVEESAKLIDCASKPYTEAEITFAMGLYLQHNYQDQAFIPILSFAALDNTRAPLKAEFNKESNELVFLTTDAIQRGEKLTLTFGRGPNVFLVAEGTFDADQSRGLEVGLNVPLQDETMRSVCNPSELQFMPNGHPREGLVSCILALVAPETDRKRVVRNRKARTPEMYAYAYGNLTYAATQLYQSGSENAEVCTATSNPAAKAIVAYVEYKRMVAEAALQYTQKEMELKYAAAGLAMPSAGGSFPSDGADDMDNGSGDPMDAEEP